MTWNDQMKLRAELAARALAGTAHLGVPVTVKASTYGGRHDKGTPGSSGYKSNDLRLSVWPAPMAIAELSTNPTTGGHPTPLADLDYRAIMESLPLEERRILIKQRYRPAVSLNKDPKTGLPHAWPLVITSLTSTHGTAVFKETQVAAKVDIGAGGPNLPVMDLWWQTAEHFAQDGPDMNPGIFTVTFRVVLP